MESAGFSIGLFVVVAPVLEALLGSDVFALFAGASVLLAAAQPSVSICTAVKRKAKAKVVFSRCGEGWRNYFQCDLWRFLIERLFNAP